MKKIFILSIIFVALICADVLAALDITSVYPTLGKVGDNLQVTLSGTGFDQDTRVSMFLESGNTRSIAGSIESSDTSYDVEVVGNIAYVADGFAGLRIFNIENPRNPIFLGAYDTPGDAQGVAVSGNYAYIADGTGIFIIDVSDPKNPTKLKSFSAYYKIYDVEIFGSTVCIRDHNLYFMDITNPVEPTIISSLDYFFLGMAAVGNMLYVVDFDKRFMIVDISDPYSPSIKGIWNLPSDKSLPSWGNPVSAENTSVFLSMMGDGVMIIDVSDPNEPTISKTFDVSFFAASTIPKGNILYISDSDWGVEVVDINDPFSPVLLNEIETPGTARMMSVENNLLLVASSVDGVSIIDMDLIKDPPFDFPGRISLLEIPGIDHFDVSGSTVYISDHTSKSLIIADISDPFNPKVLSTLPMPASPYLVRADGTTVRVWVHDSSQELQIVDVTNPASPFIKETSNLANWAPTAVIVGNYAYNPEGINGLRIYDISNLASPTLVAKVASPLDKNFPGLGLIVSISNLVVKNQIAYVAVGHNGVMIIDVSDPTKPQTIATYDTPGSPMDLRIDGNMLYIADGSDGMQIIDISDPRNPIAMSWIDTFSANDFRMHGEYALVADWDKGLLILPAPKIITPTSVSSSSSMTLTLPSPPIAGFYNLRVIKGTDAETEIGAVSFLLSDDWSIQNKKKAVIVAGGGPYNGNSLWDATKLSTNYAYRALLAQGYNRENIHYLSPEKDTDADGDGAYNDIDGSTSFEELSSAITTWAKDATEVLVYITDHGGSGTFRLNEDRVLTAQELDTMLDSLQGVMPGKVILVYDACQSGSFLPKILPATGKEHDRIVIASALADENASFINGGVLSFSYQFWSYLRSNANLLKAFELGKAMMKNEQTVLVDANGNGIANEKEDYTLSSSVTVCRGKIISTSPPQIGQAIQPQTLTGSTSVTIWAKDIKAVNSLAKVWAVINPPGYDDAPQDIPATDYPAVEMTDNDNDGVYSVAYNGFARNGTYDITILASDQEGLFSIPVKTSVVQSGGSSAPLAMATPKGGIYNSAQQVRLVPSESDSKIYYSINASVSISSQVYSGPITISADSTLNFMPVSASGVQGDVFAEDYSVDLIPPASPAIEANNNLSSGANPYPLFTWSAVQDAQSYSLEYSNNSLFSDSIKIDGILKNSYEVAEALPSFGTWYWRVAAVDQAGNHSQWSNLEYNYQEETRTHKAIILFGGVPDQSNEAWQAAVNITKYAYEVLVHQGYGSDNIVILGPGTGHDIAENSFLVSSKDILAQAIVNWAADADDLICFLVGKGNQDSFQMSATEQLSPAELDSYLDQLQTVWSGNLYVIVDSDYSGIFTQGLVPPAGKDRIVISGTEKDEHSKFSFEGVLSFSHQFWSSIYYNADLKDAFTKGRIMLKNVQHAQLEADGNSKANQKGDLLKVDNVLLGIGRRSASTPPEIETVSSPTILNGTSSSEISIGNITSLNEITRVFAVINRFDSSEVNASPVVNSEITIDLSYSAGEQKYKVNYDGFTLNGLYKINIYAEDEQGFYSQPASTMVAKGIDLPVYVDIDGDGHDDFELNTLLEILSGTNQLIDIPEPIDIDGDGRLGLEEAVKALQIISNP